jgi:hypothetical protein
VNPMICVKCLAYGRLASLFYRLGPALSERARQIVKDRQKVTTGLTTFEYLDQSTQFYNMDVFAEFVQFFGNEFMYLDPIGCIAYPVAVTMSQGDAVCVAHIPPFNHRPLRGP